MKIFLYIPVIFLSIQGFGQEIARFTVSAGDADRLDCPVGISLDQINYNEDGGPLSVFEITGKLDVTDTARVVHDLQNLQLERLGKVAALSRELGTLESLSEACKHLKHTATVLYFRCDMAGF